MGSIPLMHRNGHLFSSDPSTLGFVFLNLDSQQNSSRPVIKQDVVNFDSTVFAIENKVVVKLISMVSSNKLVWSMESVFILIFPCTQLLPQPGQQKAQPLLG